LADGSVANYFELPHWARVDDCPVASQRLSDNFSEACLYSKNHIVPKLLAWKRGQDLLPAPDVNVPGSLGWIADKFKASRKFKRKIRADTRRQYEYGLDILLKIERRSGIPMKHVQARELTSEVVEELIKIVEIQAEGTVSHSKDAEPATDAEGRGNQAFYMIASWRRAFNVVRPGNERLIPRNPFEKLEYERIDKKPASATFSATERMVVGSDELGLSSIGTALWLAFEVSQRVTHIIRCFTVECYRPPDRPNEMLVVDEKTNQEAWFLLFDENGDDLYEGLRERLDKLKGERRTGLMFIRDHFLQEGIIKTWCSPTGNLNKFRKHYHKILRHVGNEVPADLQPRSFRKGGINETADSGATFAELHAQTGQSAQTTLIYLNRSQTNIVEAKKKRNRRRAAQKNVGQKNIGLAELPRSFIGHNIMQWGGSIPLTGMYGELTFLLPKDENAT
jgi:hypothetical protein